MRLITFVVTLLAMSIAVNRTQLTTFEHRL